MSSAVSDDQHQVACTLKYAGRSMNMTTIRRSADSRRLPWVCDNFQTAELDANWTRTARQPATTPRAWCRIRLNQAENRRSPL